MSKKKNKLSWRQLRDELVIQIAMVSYVFVVAGLLLAGQTFLPAVMIMLAVTYVYDKVKKSSD